MNSKVQSNCYHHCFNAQNNKLFLISDPTDGKGGILNLLYSSTDLPITVLVYKDIQLCLRTHLLWRERCCGLFVKQLSSRCKAN